MDHIIHEKALLFDIYQISYLFDDFCGRQTDRPNTLI